MRVRLKHDGKALSPFDEPRARLVSRTERRSPPIIGRTTESRLRGEGSSARPVGLILFATSISFGRGGRSLPGLSPISMCSPSCVPVPGNPRSSDFRYRRRAGRTSIDVDLNAKRRWIWTRSAST
jgi:hypothetical protein